MHVRRRYSLGMHFHRIRSQSRESVFCAELYTFAVQLFDKSGRGGDAGCCEGLFLFRLKLICRERRKLLTEAPLLQ